MRISASCAIRSPPFRQSASFVGLFVGTLATPRRFGRGAFVKLHGKHEMRNAYPMCHPEEMIKRAECAMSPKVAVIAAYEAEAGLPWKYGVDLRKQLSSAWDEKVARRLIWC